jgi:hypothetical protein
MIETSAMVGRIEEDRVFYGVGQAAFWTTGPAGILGKRLTCVSCLQIARWSFLSRCCRFMVNTLVGLICYLWEQIDKAGFVERSNSVRKPALGVIRTFVVFRNPILRSRFFWVCWEKVSILNNTLKGIYLNASQPFVRFRIRARPPSL